MEHPMQKLNDLSRSLAPLNQSSWLVAGIVPGVERIHEMMNSRERRLSSWSNATCAMPLCEALSSRRGRGPHHAQIDRVGTWDISGPTAGGAAVRIGKARSRSR